MSSGYRVGQLRMIFSLSKTARERVFLPGVEWPKRLAYVEWFTSFKREHEDHHLMYKVSREVRGARRVATVEDVEDIRRSVLLIPKFGRELDTSWTSDNVLERCHTFFVNSHTDRHTFITVV